MVMMMVVMVVMLVAMLIGVVGGDWCAVMRNVILSFASLPWTKPNTNQSNLSYTRYQVLAIKRGERIRPAPNPIQSNPIQPNPIRHILADCSARCEDTVEATSCSSM